MRRRWPWLLVLPAAALAWILLAPAPSSPPVADPWGPEPRFAACASCHLADASGRPDGAVPRLAGQLPEVLVSKLRRIASGTTRLPVMEPFAASLTPPDLDGVAAWLGALSAPVGRIDDPSYAALCAACHGAGGEGSAALGAPRLCGQHAGYVARRLDEIAVDARGDADPAMAALVATLPTEARRAVAEAVATCGATG